MSCGNLMVAEATAKDPETTIDEAVLAASCLAALRGYGQADAAQALRAMAERATRRRRGEA